MDRERDSQGIVEELSNSVSAANSAPERLPEVIVHRNTPVEIERRRNSRIQTFSLATLAVGAALTLMYFAQLVLIVLMVSVLLAFVLAPIVEFCERRFRMPKSVGAGIAVTLLVIVLYGVTWVSYNRAIDFLQQLPKYSQEVRGIAMRFRHRAEQIQKTTESVLPATREDREAVKVRQTPDWTDWLSRTAANLTEIVLLASFVPFLVYFMLSWQEHVRTQTVMLFKFEHRNTAYVTLGMISSMIRGFIVGNVIVGLFVSVLSTLAFWWMGLPYPYFIGFISGFLTLVPYLGVVLALLPPLVAGIGQADAEIFFAIFAVVLGLHLFALNVLYPKILGKRLQLNPLAITIALLFWGWLWGAMGLILAVPITAAMKIVFDHVDVLRPYGAWLGE